MDFSAIRSTLADWQFHEHMLEDRVGRVIENASIIISNKVTINADAIRQASHLKLICVAATGINNVDIEAAHANDVTVCNVRDYATASVTQHVFALILALMTRLPLYKQAVEQGEWTRSQQFCLLDFPINELAGKTLGIIGYGVLGQAIAKLAQCFAMQVCVYTRRPESAGAFYSPINELLQKSDIVSLHCPLTADTRHLIGHRELALMKPTALLINAARGGIVEESELAQALLTGTIGGAGIDVLTEEPPRQGNPLLDPGIPNLIVTPHIAWASRESRQRLLNEVAENIRAFQAGKPRNVVC